MQTTIEAALDAAHDPVEAFIAGLKYPLSTTVFAEYVGDDRPAANDDDGPRVVETPSPNADTASDYDFESEICAGEKDAQREHLLILGNMIREVEALDARGFDWPGVHLPPALAQHPVPIMFASGKFASHWYCATVSYAGLVWLTQQRIPGLKSDVKDARGIVLSSTRTGTDDDEGEKEPWKRRRKKERCERVDGVSLDADAYPTRDMVQPTCLVIAYSTSGDGKNSEKLSRETHKGAPTPDAVRACRGEEKARGYKNLRIGVGDDELTLSFDPQQRTRYLIVFKRPLEGDLLKRLIDRGVYDKFAAAVEKEALGTTGTDTKCFEPVRVAYLGIEPQYDAPAYNEVIGPEELFDPVPTAERILAENPPRERKQQTGEIRGGEVPPSLRGNLKGVLLGSIIDDLYPELVKGSNNIDPLVLKCCPFADEHGSKTGQADGSAYVYDANDEYMYPRVKCHHETCKDRKTEEFVAAMIESGEIEREQVFEDADYRLVYSEAKPGGAETTDDVAPTDNYTKIEFVNWQNNGESHGEVCRSVQRAIVRQQTENPTLFDQGGRLVRVQRDKRLNETRAEPVTQAGLRTHIDAEVCKFRFAKSDKESNVKTKDVPCPRDIAEHVYNLPLDDFPVLTGIATAPFFDGEGNLVVTPGYHEASGYYLALPKGLDVPPVPEEPTAEDVRGAVGNLDDALCDFPFDDGDDTGGQSSKATVIAKLVQTFVREMIDGPCPLYVTQKPKARTGASLLMDVVSIIALGTATRAMTEKATDEEYDKVIVTLLKEGARHIVFDNLSKKLDSAPVAQLITSTIYRGRELGSSRSIAERVTQLVEVAGNNVQLSDELRERALLTVLNARCERPQDRSGFRHPELKPYVKERRGVLVWSVLVIIQNWIARGRPAFSGKSLGAFESYCRIVGGILEAAGVKGFMANRAALSDSTGDDSGALKAFVQMWWDTFKDADVPIGALDNHASALMYADDNDPNALQKVKSLCDLLLKHSEIINLGFNNWSKSGWAKGMGQAINFAKDQTFDLEDDVKVTLVYRRTTVGGVRAMFPALVPVK